MTQEKAMNMSNEQAIKLLQSLMLMMCDQHGCPVSDVYFALEKAVEALTGQQWIPYSENSEKLPKDRQRCLVTIKYGSKPEIIHCKDCKYAEVADPEDEQDGYTCQFHRGSIWFSGSYCSWAERKQDEQTD